MDTINNTAIFILEQDSDIDYVIEHLNTVINDEGKAFLNSIVTKMTKPISLLIEESYVDKVYRDSFYNYFSNKHFDTPRDCKRITFFEGEIDSQSFYTREGHILLNEKVIGFVVIRPISPGCIGRTILNPKKLNIPNSFIRTTSFSFVVLGVCLGVDAFPFSSQDTETMSCAETTAWNILEYYGTRYPEYKIVNPSDILSVLSKYSFERVLPTRGLQYTQVATIFKEHGFAPRLYFSGAYNNFELKRLFHYYVESGIPIGSAIKAEYQGRPVGHSVVCVGHSSEKNINAVPNTYNGRVIINSADFYNKYVLMDDNQTPYVVSDFNGFTLYNNPVVFGFVVPLYKRIFLEAGDAHSIAFNTLCDTQYGIDVTTLNFGNNNKYDEINNPMVVRLFLTSSRKYKHFKSINAGNEYMANVITQLSMPKFIWVAEISLKSLYLNNEIFGEIIIDATASRCTFLNSLVLVHYPEYIGWRNKNEPLTKLFDMLKLRYNAFNSTYPLYSNNLIGG